MAIKSVQQNKTQAIVAAVATALSNDPIDELGLLKAKIATDVKRIKQLEDQLKQREPGVYQGVAYSVTVSEQPGRETLIREQVEKFLSHQQLHASIKQGDPFKKLSVNAISADRIAA